ncbi:MAG: alpha/beta hydrolase [Lachnospiraceae bacterium]|nr:alpha/beta hydrolase [Lachnospiraceae bacterium]
MIAEKIILGENTAFSVEGIITIPDEAKFTGPFPAVVLVHGSGAHDMDETIYEVKPFKDIAEGLAELGIAAIRYNMRTWTYGKELRKANIKSFTVAEEKIEDALLATEMLKKDTRIDANRIFLVGHSLGGCIAPRMEVESGAYAGLIILAGSPRRFEEFMTDQQDGFLENANRLVKWIGGKQVAKLRAKFENIYEKSDEEAMQISFAGGTTMYYMKDLGKTQVAEYLKEITKPIFVLHPARDLQVSIEKDFNRYKEILANHPDVRFKLYDGLNHAFMTAHYSTIKDAIKEFKVKQHVKDYVIQDLAEWILAR